MTVERRLLVAMAADLHGSRWIADLSRADVAGLLTAGQETAGDR